MTHAVDRFGPNIVIQPDGIPARSKLSESPSFEADLRAYQAVDGTHRKEKVAEGSERRRSESLDLCSHVAALV